MRIYEPQERWGSEFPRPTLLDHAEQALVDQLAHREPCVTVEERDGLMIVLGGALICDLFRDALQALASLLTQTQSMNDEVRSDAFSAVRAAEQHLKQLGAKEPRHDIFGP